VNVNEIKLFKEAFTVYEFKYLLFVIKKKYEKQIEVYIKIILYFIIFSYYS